MKLLTKEIINKLPAFNTTDELELESQVVICKFFTPWSNWSWFVFEGEQTDEGDYLFYGMVHGFEKEIGYFCLSELESIKSFLGLHIERDRSVFCNIYGELTNKG